MLLPVGVLFVGLLLPAHHRRNGLALPLYHRRDVLVAGTAAASVFAPALQASSAELQPASGKISGKTVPLTVGLGTCLVRAEDAGRMVSLGIDAGYRVFDTAQRYANEAGVGKGVQRQIDAGKVTRDEVFISTKVWVDNMGSGKCAKSVEESAKALGLDYIDQVLIHWPGEFLRAGGAYDATNRALRAGTWSDLEALQQRGLVKQIGVSNFSERHLRELLGYANVKPSVDQFEVHPYNQRPALVSLCRENDIRIMSYCPLGGKGNKGQVTDVLLKDNAIKAIAAAHGKTNAQVILRWHLQRGLTPLPKSSSKAHAVENFDVFDFELADAEMRTIAGLDRGQFALFDADALA